MGMCSVTLSIGFFFIWILGILFMPYTNTLPHTQGVLFSVFQLSLFHHHS